MAHGLGIIGAGVIGEFHAKAVSALDNCQLAAVLDTNAAAAEAFGATHGCQAFTDIKQFLNHPDLDVVTICTPSGSHLDPALAAIEAGKHLIIEKPLEITLERCDAIIEAAAKKGVRLSGIFQSRFHEAPQLLKQAVDGGRFGRLTLGDAYVKWYRSQEYYDKGGWRGTWALDGGGALINQSIHAIDLLRWLMGPVDQVMAFTDTLGHERIEVEDTAVAALRFANGALGVIEGSTAVFPGFLKKIEISGTAGSASLEEESLKTWSFADETDEDKRIQEKFLNATGSGGGAADPKAIGVHGHIAQFRNFLDALDNQGGTTIGGEEARNSVEIILAVYESARTGKAVKLQG